MKQRFHVAHTQASLRPAPRRYRYLRSTGLWMSGVAGLFLGCAASPEKPARAPNSAMHLADVRPGGLAPQRARIALIALPDRVYEIPMQSAGRTGFAPASVASAGEPVAARGVDAFSTANARLAPHNVVLAGVLPAVFPVTESAAAVTIEIAAQPEDAPVAQTVAPATLVQAPVVSAVQQATQRETTYDDQPAMVQPVAFAETATPKLKLDTDYESVRHPILFAFNRATLGRQAQALLARILPDAKVATQVRVTGYSDSIGTRAANERIAVARAHSIRDELVKNDVAPGKISVEPAVVMAPAKTRQPPSYYAQFRRVDVDITQRKPAQIISMADTLSPAK